MYIITEEDIQLFTATKEKQGYILGATFGYIMGVDYEGGLSKTLSQYWYIYNGINETGIEKVWLATAMGKGPYASKML